METRYGRVTTGKADFGYGMVWLEGGAIHYMDPCGYKTWKTAKGFERWVEKQNATNGGVYGKIDASMCKHVSTVLGWR